MFSKYLTCILALNAAYPLVDCENKAGHVTVNFQALNFSGDESNVPSRT